MKKTSVNPIWVSKIKSVSYVNGRVHRWSISVRFDGDLASWHNENPLPHNVQQFKEYMKWTDADVERMENDNIHGCHKSIERMFFEFKKEMALFYSNDIPYTLNPRLDIPQRNNISVVKWDQDSKQGDNEYSNTLVEYVFTNGWFRNGRQRAQNFRNKMLAKINEQKIKDFKAELLKQENENIK